MSLRGYLHTYRVLGYQHGRALANGEGDDYASPSSTHRCGACESPFFFTDDEGTDLCECGCRDEYIAAKRYAYHRGLRTASPVTVRAYMPGYITIGGDHYPSRILEERDAWSMCDAKRAVRYLRGEYAHHRENGVRVDVVVAMSYATRKDAA